MRFRGRLLSFVRAPDGAGDAPSYRSIDDGIVLAKDGRIAAAGPANEILPLLPAGLPVDSHADALIMPGFIDPHIHYPQTQVIASYGAQLLDWLEKYTFVEEQKFADPAHAARNAEFFLDELARNGTATACAYCSAHPASAEALFSAADRRGAGMIAGTAIMNRNGPKPLLEGARDAISASRDLIARWHGNGRQRYAVTPRFAITSTDEQLAAAGALLEEFPTVLMQTHLDEIATRSQPSNACFRTTQAIRRSMRGSACSARARCSAIAFISPTTKSRCCATPARWRCSARRQICSSAAACSITIGSRPPACALHSPPTSAAARPTPCCGPRPRPTR